MSDKPVWIEQFERPAGTEIKHIGNHWYLYERLTWKSVIGPAAIATVPNAVVIKLQNGWKNVLRNDCPLIILWRHSPCRASSVFSFDNILARQ